MNTQIPDEHDPLCHMAGRDPSEVYTFSIPCECETIQRVRADERRKVAEEIARRIERMVPAHPKTWNGKWLVGRRMAAHEARRAGLPLFSRVGSK